MPGQEILKDDRGTVDPKYFCSSCDLLLIEPMQTVCGHLMCKSCVQLILRNSNPVCPKDGTSLDEKEVFPDGYTRRELGELQLHCVHNECDWIGPAKDLQAHINVCDHTVITCSHDQCNKEVKRFLLAKHLEEECFYRSVTCKHCEEQLPFATLEKHVEETCVFTLLTCEHCRQTDIPRRDMKKHQTEECEEIEVECDFRKIGCNHTEVSKRKHLHKHYKDVSRFHTQLILKFILEVQGEMQNVAATFDNFATKQLVLDEVKAIKEVLDARIKSMEDKLSAMIATVPGLMRRLDNLESRQASGSTAPGSRDEIKRLEVKMLRMEEEMKKLEAKNNRLEAQLREKTEFLERYRNKVDELDQSVAVMMTRLADVEPSVERPAEPVNYNGVLLWIIKDFQRKRQDAISGVTTAIYSPHFYSSQFGYKMCAKLYMNGDGVGRGFHLSLFFVVMKGEYDALQSWPFQKKITMMLMDQGDGNHMIDAFHSDPQSSSFQRPRSDMNIASGSPLFMPLDSLNTREYIKDDVMFIKIIVD